MAVMAVIVVMAVMAVRLAFRKRASSPRYVFFWPTSPVSPPSLSSLQFRQRYLSAPEKAPVEGGIGG